MKNNWQRKKLLDVCDFKVKKNTKSLPYVGMEDVESNTGNFLGSLEVRGMKSTTAHFDIDCVLYGKLRPYLNKVFVPDFEGHCSTEFIPLRVDKNLLSREWLAIFLRSQRIVKELSKNVTGARMPRTSLDFMKKIKIPLPPLAKQKEIVEHLDCISEKVKKLQELHTQTATDLDALEQSVLSQAFEQ